MIIVLRRSIRFRRSVGKTMHRHASDPVRRPIFRAKTQPYSSNHLLRQGIASASGSTNAANASTGASRINRRARGMDDERGFAVHDPAKLPPCVCDLVASERSIEKPHADVRSPMPKPGNLPRLDQPSRTSQYPAA